jgi:hypothetical protein
MVAPLPLGRKDTYRTISATGLSHRVHLTRHLVRPDTKERLMDPYSHESSAGELVEEVGALATGLGILSTTFFPFALPALAFGLLLALPLIVVALPVVAVWLLVRAMKRLAASYGVKRKVTTSPSRTS